MIADAANLKIVQWDGYLKYMSPSPKLCEQQREKIANKLKTILHQKKAAPEKDSVLKEKTKKENGNKNFHGLGGQRMSLRGRSRIRAT